MSDPLETAHLKLPYLAAAQAQKHVTHNEALKRLDTLVQLAVRDAGLDTPPATPAAGDRYIVAAAATGDWADNDGDVATFVDGAWEFAAPEAGWLAYDAAGETLLVHADGGWHSIAGYFGAVEKFGVNAIADDTSRLAVRSAAVLFSAIEAADGGSGDIRFTVNKEADGDTASLLFQSGWSGRAEVGLADDTDLVFKVSPDGSAWVEAIRIDKDTGLAAILYDNSLSGLAATSVQDAIDEVAASGGAVVSVFGRTGAVSAAAADYDASQVDNDSSVSGASVKDALDTLAGSIAAKQAADSDLTALAGVSAAGLLARTGSGTAAARTITAGAGISVANGDGVSGNPTIAGSTATTAAYGDVKLGAEVREKLTANRTYYVRTDGSNANTGLANTSGGAWLTRQYAYDWIAANLDLAGYTVTVQMAAGTYTGGFAPASSWVGGGTLAFLGDTTTPANVIISTTSADCWAVGVPLGGILSIKGFKLQTTTGGSGIYVSVPGVSVEFDRLNFGTIVGQGIWADAPGSLIYCPTNSGAYTVSGNCTIHACARWGGKIRIRGITVTLTGTPAWSYAGFEAETGGLMEVDFLTFSGSATGTRYVVDLNAVIRTGGGGASYLPGNSAGSATNGGQYA